MLYLDRRLKPLTTFDWNTLIRDPNYTTIEKAKVRSLTVETSWVGIAPDWEQPPKIFLTVVYRHTLSESSKPHTHLAEVEVWSTTEHKAKAEHARLVAQIENGGLKPGLHG